jgi:hypothetical protein
MCWANVGFPLATLLANDVGPFALGWPNDFCQQCLQFANKVPTNFGRKLWWANDYFKHILLFKKTKG